MSDRAPYSRVYWSVRTDPKFVGIYSHDGHLATWLRLLIAADATWPAPADLPASARKRSVDALAAAGLIDLLPDGLFKVHGLDAERGRRREAAQANADGRQTGSKRGANGEQTGPVWSASRERDEEELRRDENEQTADAAVSLHRRTGQFPSPKILSWINDLATAHGEERLTTAIDTTPLEGRNVRDYLVAVRDGLRAEDHAANRSERAAEIQRVAEKRRPIVVRPPVEDVSDEEAERLAREFMGRPA